MVATRYIELKSRGANDIIDITLEVQTELEKTNLNDGIVTIFVPGSTGAVSTIEYESGLLQDLPELYEKLIPRNKSYYHDATWGDANGFSHLRATLQGSSLTVPFTKGKLILGTWQQIIFIECDNRPRRRRLVLQFIGE